ncbi:MAG: GIY-YIG nuclease family protein [Elusimicrobiota bacterium]|jgi:putative endonuclease|nr:GIY-YIG nuclease family protein [Elusimicrobiota bacterium]
MDKYYYVYILANKENGTIYTGVTNNLRRRVIEHKTKQVKGFTSKYNVDNLVWFETIQDINIAIEFEKKIKNRGRQWKIDLIEKNNPNWEDLSKEILDIE